MATAVQKARIMSLYKKSMKTLLDWTVSRDVFYVQAAKLRNEFEKNMHLDTHDQIERAIVKGEGLLKDWVHPDPYIVPYRPGGSLYARNPPIPESVKLHLDFGREGGH